MEHFFHGLKELFLVRVAFLDLLPDILRIRQRCGSARRKECGMSAPAG